MVRRRKKPDEDRREIMDEIKLGAYAWTCRTALIAAGGACAVMWNLIVTNSERAYSAMHFLVFGRLP